MKSEEKINLLLGKDYAGESVFQPENLLREARRQKNIPKGSIPSVCVLDPDGDIVRYLIKTGQASVNPCWACYHTTLYDFSYQGMSFGIIGCAVGASFAVLLAEQLFVSGCRLLVSITSAGIITPLESEPSFVLISEAIRDEGTSYHYLPPEKPATLSADLLIPLSASFEKAGLMAVTGKSWTTDAPYRETEKAIAKARAQGALAVEMEAAALYAFAQAKGKPVVCYAHLTNSMAQHGEDFEKGAENGSLDSLALLYHTAATLLPIISNHYANKGLHAN
ncbi:nucleoside phosphorylase [Rhodocytophaga aerolata]|uniref:Nucleoside phosphorylase n=1 Tax=Rhodocytophaga aerolata TaxID=455078 RepID=A0ABT8RFQ1_9BACT|nr:nucleoside phosphorylase [Rhodocytophaga aerolata]MDO1449620.1 nucleoside phosphorylase [Rhodocytophaga aerolata]